jgi:glycosyltransferase involved in cell wall biosynthesis
MALFEQAVRIDPDLMIVGGDRYFTENLETVAGAEKWFIGLRNRFLFGRSFCWQPGAFSELAQADAVMAELNPRILSTWGLALFRWVVGRRLVFWGHVRGRGLRPTVLRRLRRFMLDFADGMVTYSGSEAEDLRRSGYRKPIWTAHNSCVVEADVRPVAGEQRSFVCVGRLVPEKKPELLIRAFGIFATKNAGFRVDLVGVGPESPRLVILVKELGLGDSVRFHGEVTGATSLRAIYEGALAAVSPGSVGLSAIQSMAHGVPILIARDQLHGPEIEACVEGETCRFFDPDSPEALSRCLERTVREAGDWRDRRQRICDSVRKERTIERMATVLVNALNGRG